MELITTTIFSSIFHNPTYIQSFVLHNTTSHYCLHFHCQSILHPSFCSSWLLDIIHVEQICSLHLPHLYLCPHELEDCGGFLSLTTARSTLQLYFYFVILYFYKYDNYKKYIVYLQLSLSSHSSRISFALSNNV